MEYPYTLTMRFRSEKERQHFLYHWFNHHGDYLAGFDTEVDLSSPSWQGETPELKCKLFVAHLDEYDSMDDYTRPYSTNFSKPE